MSQELLQMIQDSQNLVNGDIVSTQLNSLLIGFCDLFNKQQSEIDGLKKELQNSKEIEAIQRKNSEGKDQQFIELQNQFLLLRNELQTAVAQLNQQSTFFKTQIEENSTRNSNKLSEIENSVDSQISLMTLQNSKSEEKTKKAVNEVIESNNKITSQFDEIKQLLEKYGLSTIDKLIEKISIVEARLDDNYNQIFEIRADTIKMSEDAKKAEKTMEKSIHDEVFLLNAKIKEMENSIAAAPEIQEMVLTGEELGLGQILQTVMRDSRRLDSFDQQVSSVRNECENMANGLASFGEAMKQFSHQIFDLGLEIKRTTTGISNEINGIKNFSRYVGKTVYEMLNDMIKMSDAHYHLTSTTTLSLDEITNLLSKIIGRKIQSLSTLDDINIEANSIKDELTQKKVELNMFEHMKSLDGKTIEIISEEKLTRKEVPEYEKIMKPFQGSVKLKEAAEEANKDNSMAKKIQQETDVLLMITLEDLRVHVNDMEKMLFSMDKTFKDQFDEVQNQLKCKMGIEAVDRIITKMQNSLRKMQIQIVDIERNDYLMSKGVGSQNLHQDIDNVSMKSFPDDISISSAVTSTSLNIKPSKLSGIGRPSTALPISIKCQQIKKKFDDPNQIQTQRKIITRKSNSQNTNNSVNLSPKGNNHTKLASHYVSTLPKE